MRATVGDYNERAAVPRTSGGAISRVIEVFRKILDELS